MIGNLRFYARFYASREGLVSVRNDEVYDGLLDYWLLVLVSKEGLYIVKYYEASSSPRF